MQSLQDLQTCTELSAACDFIFPALKEGVVSGKAAGISWEEDVPLHLYQLMAILTFCSRK